ncbi:SCA7, zinc-binding domain-containing protein [Vararia minispora EC-137]|uniref:SCA7, zinc-binding domain-containing protein n=1 Tax=Vararia minispora EC-137 TaxID=1314806 RepID=A0ACB8QHW6_9AGAM|nr:SCA7, zinc-binding domain-containing protein [Vararia minispora EC-137]
MTLKLKLSPSPPPFSFENMAAEPSTATTAPPNPPAPPTLWLSAREMHIYGSAPLRNTSEIGLVQCNDCIKVVLRTAMAEHAATCQAIRTGKKGVKAKLDEAGASKGRKRKADDGEPDDAPKTKKAKASAQPKAPPKPRVKGPIDLDKHCGVINDKNLPCSRSLTCKSHSMGAKRGVQGRSKDYDVLLLEWNRAHNPNFVEPVKKESKKERKEKKDAEKRERKQRELEDFARKKGIDLSQPGAEAQLEQLKAQTKKKKQPANTANVAGGTAGGGVARRVEDLAQENLAELDSEEELEAMVKGLRATSEHGLVGAPLASPCDSGSWFVMRRERLRNCKDLFASALMKSGTSSTAGSAARLSISGT